MASRLLFTSSSRCLLPGVTFLTCCILLCPACSRRWKWHSYLLQDRARSVPALQFPPEIFNVLQVALHFLGERSLTCLPWKVRVFHLRLAHLDWRTRWFLALHLNDELVPALPAQLWRAALRYSFLSHTPAQRWRHAFWKEKKRLRFNNSTIRNRDRRKVHITKTDAKKTSYLFQHNGYLPRPRVSGSSPRVLGNVLEDTSGLFLLEPEALLKKQAQ